MDVSLNKPWDGMVDTLVHSGCYGSPREVIEEGLRLVEARERQREWLRAKLQKTTGEGGSYTDEDMEAYLDGIERKLEAEGR